MKKTIIFSCLIFLIVQLMFSQVQSKKVDIKWGPEKKESKRLTLSDIVGTDDTGFYALKTKAVSFSLKSKIILEKYNNELINIESVEIDLSKEKQERDYEFIIHHNNSLYLFSSFKNQKLKKNFLFIQSIDKNTLNLNDDLRKIAEVSYEKKSKLNAGSFNIDISRDSSNVLIYYDLPYNKNESERFGFHVFDKNFNQIWEKNITLPYTDKLFQVENYEVDKFGNVHLLGIIYKEKRKEKRKGKPNYKYQLLSYTNNGEDLTEYPINIEGKFLTDMQIAINDDQDIICGGFYSSEGTFSIEGSYFISIDSETKEISSSSFQKFGIDFITQNMSKRQEKKTKKKAAKGKDTELYQYDLDNIVLRDDGGALLIGEQYYVRVVTRSTTTNGVTTTSTTYYYYYNDIIVINMSPLGEIEWTQKIPKRQVTTSDGGFYSSYDVSVMDDKLYFIFNDNPKNLNYSKTKKLYNFVKSKDALAVLVTLDCQGNQTREALFSTRKTDVLIRPKVCEQISKNEVILFGQRKKTHRFAKVTFLDE